MRGSSILLLGASSLVSAADLSKLNVADLQRAKTPRPPPTSAVSAATPAGAFIAMNNALQHNGVPTKRCDSFGHEDLNDVQRTLYKARSTELDALYKAKGDRRGLHFDTLDYKERLWKGETMTADIPHHTIGTPQWNATRDGKCAEAVMWWTHHLAAPARTELSSKKGFVLPTMPDDVAPHGLGGHEYALQISCTDCHIPMHTPGKPPSVPTPPRPSGLGPQYNETCPDVYYDRTKRCDWDFEPFCKPCEGIGGLAWGNKKGEYNPMECTPLMTPDQIPKDNLTNPYWPKSFSVDEYAELTFPGRDPCKVDFKNSTYTLYFDTRDDGPIYHTVGHTGPSGPSPFPGDSWHLGNGNFYTTVDTFHKEVFCVCLTPVCDAAGCPSNTVLGPLTYDFLKGAKLVGRERIVPEYLLTPMVADHWVKGPHHFWIDVATNLMVREWQPFNGFNLYHNWNLTKPDASIIDVKEVCYKGLLHHNISCIAPPPHSK